MKQPKMLTTTITRAAFAEKMLQVAAEGKFTEFKRIDNYWKKRLKSVRLPAEMIFLVGASPYRFAAVSIDIVEFDLIPEYARETISKTPGGDRVYAITCKPIIVPHGRAAGKQLQLADYVPAPGSDVV